MMKFPCSGCEYLGQYPSLSMVTTMTTLHTPPGFWSTGHLIEIGLSGLWRLASLFRLSTLPRMSRRFRARRDDRQGSGHMPYRAEQHFGSLDDQTLNDLGLQRSEIRAAEYGILPGEQALHVAEPDSAVDGREDPERAQSRSRT